jgi:pantothenate kinase type III
MFLGFDIGNTSTVMGIYQDGNVMPIRIFRYDTQRDMVPEELSSYITRNIDELKEKTRMYDGISGFAFSSVVPGVNSLYHDVCRGLFGFDATGFR